MGGEAEHPHQISSSDNHRCRSSHNDFRIGSLVEVRTDEEGLNGVYFSATVIPPPPPCTTISPRKDSKKLLYVEYHNLLANEDGSERLREYVDVSFVRPPPPALQDEDENDRGFKPDDVVDAFYQDGWWMGVVSRVVESGERVVVTFKDPPDEQEFGLADLRAHWDWVNGSWVKQESVRFTMSMFGEGRMVEISLDKQYYWDAWVPARIDQDLGNGVLSIKYDIGKDVIAKFDSHNIRPCPPVLVNDKKRFVLLEKVDTYFDYAWWSGMITKELENRRYIVFFKRMKRDKEFDQWKLRPHMEWKDGKWLLPSFSDDGVRDQNFSDSAESVVDGKALASLTSRKQLNPPDDWKMSLNKRRRHYSSDSRTALKKVKEGYVVQDRHDKPIKQVLCGSVNNVETSAAAQTTAREEKIMRKLRSVCGKRNVLRGKTMKRTLPRVDQEKGLQDSVWLQGENRSLERGTIQNTRGKIAVQVQDSVGEKMMQVNRVDDENSGTQAASALVDKGSIVPNEAQSLFPCVQKKIGLEHLVKDSEKQQRGNETQASSTLVDKCCEVSSEQHSLPFVEDAVVIVIDDDSEKEPESGTEASSLVDESCKVSSLQQSLSCVENTVVIVLDDDDDDGEKERESGKQASVLVDKSCEVSSEPQSLPFVKNTNTTSLWETIESMRVFQRIQQKPHFQPLELIKESFREGFTIANMVAFARLVEKACRLQLNDPKSIIDGIMKTLAGLERHGFDVSLVQDRLTKLLALKAKQEKLVHEVNNFNNHIQEHNHDETRIEEEMREINERMRKLQEKLSLAESAKEKEDDEIALLQAGLKETEESIKIVKCDFEHIVSSIL